MARLLIAEDDESVRTFVTRALTLDGHNVVAVENGSEAIEVLSGDNNFDLIISDIKMPLMDGIALALKVARDFSNLPILLMTGFADQREKAKDLDKIVIDVVQKPFSLADIRSAVNSSLLQPS